MSEQNTNNTNPNPAAVNADPAGTGEPAAGKTFTQDEVNRIVSERLARERAKAEPSAENKKEQELAARENALTCKEFIAEGKYPAVMLEVFDTTDAEKFKGSVKKLVEAFPHLVDRGDRPKITVSSGAEHGKGVADPFANIFKPKI